MPWRSAYAFEPRSPVASNGCESSVASSPSKKTKRISGAPFGRLSLRSAREISSTAAVPPAPSLAPTNPGRFLVS